VSNLNVSQALANAIQAVLSPPSISEFTLDVEITNLNDASVKLTPTWIDRIVITQSFAEKFGDVLMLEFSTTPTDYMQLFKSSQGLQVSIRYVYYDSQQSQRVFTPAPIVRVYKAMLVNPQDLSKKYTTGTLVPTNTMPLTEQHVGARIPTTLELIESDVYTLRQQRVHGIYQKAKLADAIAHIVGSFSVKQLYLVPPDNLMTWDHVIIPPALGMDEIFDYLQYHYGVYMKGIDWYFANSILYIYPAYENNPKIPYVADIYNAAEGSYAGLKSYHKSDNGGQRLSIVSTTPVKTKDISRHGAENVGSHVQFLRASSIIDAFVTVNAQGTFINNNNSLSIGNTVSRTVSARAANPRYTKPTDNIFDESSKLAKWDAVLIECGWNNAVPYLLQPGHNIRYHFDKQGVFTTQQGILERVVYTFSRQKQISHGYVFSGQAKLNFRANSDVTDPARPT
jgi:hypothetical protein